MLLGMAGASSQTLPTVQVRYTADVVGAVDPSGCSGGAARRAEALAASTTADRLLKIDGGGYAAAAATRGDVFAAMGYDGWALSAADFALGAAALQNFIDAAGSAPVASNYDTTYTATFADLGGAVLLAVAEGGTSTYRKGLEVGWAHALAAGVSLDDVVVLCVSGMSSADVSDIGASNAADAVRTLAEENTEVDLVLATGIAGLAAMETRTNHLGLSVLIVSAPATTTVESATFTVVDGGAGISAVTVASTVLDCASSADTFIQGMIDGDVDIVQIALICDNRGTAAREECDAGRAAIAAINDKNDGFFDDLLPLTRLAATVVFHDGGACGEPDYSTRAAWVSDVLAVDPVASIGPGGSTCLKSVTSNDNRAIVASYGLRSNAVFMSESSTATSIADRSLYPNVVRLSSSENIVNEALSAVTKHYNWNRVAVVYDAADAWAADAARVFSESFKAQGGSVLGNKCVSAGNCEIPADVYADEGGADLVGVRFDDATLTADLADAILDELVAVGAKIIYIAAYPADQRIIYERIKQTEKCYGAGYAILSGWLSEDIFFGSDGAVSPDAVDGARGLILAKEAVDTSSEVSLNFIAHRTPGLDVSVCTGSLIAKKYCDLDGEGQTVGGYGPQVVDTVYTLAKALDSLSEADRQDPDKIYAAVGALPEFQGFSGAISFSAVNERRGSMEISNLQFVKKVETRRRLGVPLSSTAAEFVAVGRTIDGAFVLKDGAQVIFPGDTTTPPLDHDPTSGSKSTKVDTGLIIGLVFGLIGVILLVVGVLYCWYWHSRTLHKNLAKVTADLQDFKDSVVGVKVGIKDYVPSAISSGDSTQAATATWYWKEEPHRLTAHDASLVRAPHWIMYDADVQALLEQAHSNNQPDCSTGPNYTVDLKGMEQTNARTGFKRAVLRDEGSGHETKARPDTTHADTSTRPDELLGEDALLLRTGSMIQIKNQRPDGWAYGSIILNKGDEAKDRRFIVDGISLSAGWFPLACTDVPSVEQLGELQKLLGGEGDGALAQPKYWGQVKDPLMAEYFTLAPSSEEYKRVNAAIALTTGSQQLHINAIERVQNISLWQSYCVKKSSIIGREKDPQQATRKYVRNWLFHGCGPDVVDKILQQGFNRSFCGKNATLYGKGVYFARDASYSTYPLYSPPDARGLQTIFLVRCVVGEWSKGVRDALTPAERDARRNLLYDTTVDNVEDPSIYVTYHDAQAYPEYRVRFTQSNPAQGHPQANRKRVAGYKTNLLEGVEEVKSVKRPQPRRPCSSPPRAPRQQFMVQIPAGVQGGAVMTVRTPDGRLVQVRVPPGAAPGTTIQLAV